MNLHIQEVKDGKEKKNIKKTTKNLHGQLNQGETQKYGIGQNQNNLY